MTPREIRIHKLVKRQCASELQGEHAVLPPSSYGALLRDAQLLMLTTIWMQEETDHHAGLPPRTPEQLVQRALRPLRSTRVVG